MALDAQAAHLSAVHTPSASGIARSHLQDLQLSGTNANRVPPYFKHFSAISALGDMDYTLLLVLFFQAYALKKVVGKAGGTRSEVGLGGGRRSVNHELLGRNSKTSVIDRELIISPTNSNAHRFSGNTQTLHSSLPSFSSNESWSGEMDTDNRETQKLNWAPPRRRRRVARTEPVELSSELRFRFLVPFSQIGLDMDEDRVSGHPNSPTASIEEVESDVDLEEFGTAVASEGSIGTDIDSISSASDAEDHQESIPTTSETFSSSGLQDSRALSTQTLTSDNVDMEGFKQAEAATPSTSSSSIPYENLNSKDVTTEEPTLTNPVSNAVDLGSCLSSIDVQVASSASISPAVQNSDPLGDDTLSVQQRIADNEKPSNLALSESGKSETCDSSGQGASERQKPIKVEGVQTRTKGLNGLSSPFYFAGWRRRVASIIWPRAVVPPAAPVATGNAFLRLFPSGLPELLVEGQDFVIHTQPLIATVDNGGMTDVQPVPNGVASKRESDILAYLELVLDYVDTLPTVDQRAEGKQLTAPDWRAIVLKEKVELCTSPKPSFDEGIQTSPRVGRTRQATGLLSYLELVLDYVDTLPFIKWRTGENQPEPDWRASSLKEKAGSRALPTEYSANDRRTSPVLILHDDNSLQTSYKLSKSCSQRTAGSTPNWREIATEAQTATSSANDSCDQDAFSSKKKARASDGLNWRERPVSSVTKKLESRPIMAGTLNWKERATRVDAPVMMTAGPSGTPRWCERVLKPVVPKAGVSVSKAPNWREESLRAKSKPLSLTTVGAKAPNWREVVLREESTPSAAKSTDSLTLAEFGEANGGFLSTPSCKTENKNSNKPVLSLHSSLSEPVGHGSHSVNSQGGVQQDHTTDDHVSKSKPTQSVLSPGVTRLS